MEEKQNNLYDILSYLTFCYDVKCAGEHIHLKDLAQRLETRGDPEQIEELKHVLKKLIRDYTN